jgi:hypothetical protein
VVSVTDPYDRILAFLDRDEGNACRIFVGNPKRKKSLERFRRRREVNIKLDRSCSLLNTVMRLRLPYNVGKFLRG